MMVVFMEDRGTHEGDPVYFLRDTTAAAGWVNFCGGAKDPRAVFLMWLLGVLESKGGLLHCRH